MCQLLCVCVWARWSNYRLNCSLSHSISGSSVSIDHWSSSQPGRLISGRSGGGARGDQLRLSRWLKRQPSLSLTSKGGEPQSRECLKSLPEVNTHWRVSRLKVEGFWPPRFQDPQVLFLHQDSPWRKAAVFLESRRSIFYRQRWKSNSKWACEKWALMWLALGFGWFSKVSIVILSRLHIAIHDTVKVGRGSFSLWINTANANSPSFTFFRGMRFL